MSPKLHELVDNLSLSYHLQNTPCGIMLWDKDLRLIYYSERAGEIFEWTGDEMLLAPFDLHNFIHKEDREKVTQTVTGITSGATRHNTSLNRNYTKTGKVVYCQWYNSALHDEAGNIVHVLSLVQDVTEKHLTEKSLQESESRLSVVFNGAIDPMWLIAVEGDNQYRFETINTAFSKVTGWTPEQVAGQPIEAIMPPQSHELVRTKYSEAIRTGKIIDYIEEAAHPAGTKYGEIRVIPIHDANGKVTKLIGIANDITDKVILQTKLDEERDSRNRQITSAAIKGQELERAKVSRELHDNVNQVLTTVKLYTELCIDGLDNGILLPKAARLLQETIDEIRALSKQLSAPTLGNISFQESLSDLVSTIQATGEVDIQLRFLTRHCDQLEEELHLTIYRIVQEQLTNIIKYANATTVEVLVQEREDTLTLHITDDGVGFDTDKKSPGIGITNMKSRTQMLNGSFGLESRPGEGTTVEAVFPVRLQDGYCVPAVMERSMA